MSAILVKLQFSGSGFTSVYVDGKFCGNVEDPELDFQDVLRGIFKLMGIENYEIKVTSK